MEFIVFFLVILISLLYLDVNQQRRTIEELQKQIKSLSADIAGHKRVDITSFKSDWPYVDTNVHSTAITTGPIMGTTTQGTWTSLFGSQYGESDDS